MTAVAALCGAIVGLGVWTLASGIRGTTRPRGEPGTTVLSRITRGRAPLYLAAVVVVAAVVGLLTRWPVWSRPSSPPPRPRRPRYASR